MSLEILWSITLFMDMSYLSLAASLIISRSVGKGYHDETIMNEAPHFHYNFSAAAPPRTYHQTGNFSSFANPRSHAFPHTNYRPNASTNYRPSASTNYRPNASTNYIPNG